MSDEPTTNPSNGPVWTPTPEELDRIDRNDRGYRRQNALVSAAQVSAPGTPADRVLATAAAFYDYLNTDVPPEDDFE